MDTKSVPVEELPPAALRVDVAEGTWTQYTACGLDYVYVKGGINFRSDPYEDWFYFVGLRKVHDAIGDFILAKPTMLSGPEIGFLRKEMFLTVGDAAEIWRTEADALCRWERGEGFGDHRVSEEAKNSYRSWRLERVLDRNGRVVFAGTEGQIRHAM